MNACITARNFCFYSFSASVSFDFETRIMSTCMSTSRSNYFYMSIWKKHADHSTRIHPNLNGLGMRGNTFIHIIGCVYYNHGYNALPTYDTVMYVILVLRVVTRSVLLLNTLVSYYYKLFGSLNPPWFSVIREKTIIWSHPLSMYWTPDVRSHCVRKTSHASVHLMSCSIIESE